MATKLEACAETKKILNWDNVERYLNENNLWHKPDILEWLDRNHAEYRNDSYCKMIRSWIDEENKDDFVFFDLLCEVFGIEHEINEWTKGDKEDNTELIFWISW